MDVRMCRRAPGRPASVRIFVVPGTPSVFLAHSAFDTRVVSYTGPQQSYEETQRGYWIQCMLMQTESDLRYKCSCSTCCQTYLSPRSLVVQLSVSMALDRSSFRHQMYDHNSSPTAIYIDCQCIVLQTIAGAYTASGSMAGTQFGMRSSAGAKLCVSPLPGNGCILRKEN